MSTRTRVGGGSLALRLIAIALVPMVAVTALSLERIHREEDIAAQADQVIREVELERNVAAIYAPANVERVALSGLGYIDRLGIERSVVTQFTGVDFESTYVMNKSVLNDALRRLALEHTDITVAGETLVARIARVARDLNEQRALSDEFSALPEDVSRVFDDLDMLLDDIFAHAEADLPRIPSALEDPPQLDALADVLGSAGELSQAVIAGLLWTDEANLLAVVAATAVHETHVQTFDDLLDEDQTMAFNDVKAALTEPPDVIGAAIGAPADAALNPTAVAETAAVVVAQLEYLSALDDYSMQFHAEILDSAHEQARVANDRVTQTKWLVASIGIVALLLTILVLAGTAAPLVRLSRRARAISAGDIDPNPIRVRGPNVIRRLTMAMNEMLVTLHGVDLQIARMSTGDVDRSEVPLPGAIGVSMRRSVERLSDVTEQLHRSEQLASAIVEQAADAIWTIDDNGQILLANDSSELLTGVAESEQFGQQLTDYLDRVDGESFVRAADGTRRKVLVASSVIDADSDRVTTVIAHDISERARFEAQLAHQARHDALTGLPNRFAAMEHLESLLSTSTDFLLLFADIDGFKSVNDTQGHEAGDAVLIEIAKRLSRTIRSTEFVARLGGDEFIVVQTHFDHIDDAVALGGRLIEEIELPYDSEHGIFALSASVGVVRSEPTMTALTALRQADSALYLAKRRGRGRVERFDADLQADIHHEAELALALRHGVRNGELELHLQPIMSLDTGEMNSAEALVRWSRPGVGLVGPGEFIPIAERSSLIFDIERWVLARVCERVAGWHAADPTRDVRVAVNISGRHLIEGDLVGDLDIALALTGADPGMLEFELTETHLLEDLDTATTVLNTLRARGIKIAVDDFGTGYSSMSYLRHFPVDTLKIDRSFVARATEDGYDSTIIEAVLTIARSLDLEVVAEGIETEAQLEYVRSRGCDRAQGFLLARPMPIEAAEAVLFQPSPVA